jgi:hypothetical protein
VAEDEQAIAFTPMTPGATPLVDFAAGNSCSAGGKLEEGLDFFLRRRGDNDAADRQSSVVLLFAGPSFLS